MKGIVRVTCINVLFLLCCAFVANAQKVTLSGKIIDELNGEPLISANVVVKGTTTGTATDLNGVFELEIEDTSEITVVVSYIGYQDREITYTKPFTFREIKLKDFVIPGEEVVVTASRVSESIMESAISVEKMDAREIRTAASGDFYKSLGTFKDVDVINTSMGFSVINMRGFNTSQPERTVQYIDGIDNQAPGLNFAVGNLMGANDLELQNVEIIHGAASALYGANAFQGVVNMTTKDPYLFPGLGVQLKGGSRDYFDVQGRYARTFGKNDQFAFKITGGYKRVDDWPAKDSVANLYGDIETDIDLNAITRQLQFQDTTADFDENDLIDAIKLNAWLDFNNDALPGVKTVQAPGYLEPALADYNTNAWSVSPSLHYKIKNKHELSYMFKYGRGTAVYQGTNRYSVKDITFQQHKVELKGRNYFARAYATLEDAGDSYDNVFTAINISKFGLKEWAGNYLGAYYDALDSLVGGFENCSDCLRENDIRITQAAAIAADSTQGSFPEVGSELFDSLFTAITTDPDLQSGSKFLDQSKMVHVEGQYRFDDYVKWLDLIAGATYRVFLPKSYGTIFSDTLANPGDTLADGRAMPGAEYTKISTHEFGLYAQASKKFLKDKLRLSVSLRFDKHQNFKPQLSPRGTIVFNQKNHYLRFSAQSAFRTPVLQDQYILLDLGPITLVGNVDGLENYVYTLESVDTFEAVWNRVPNPVALDVMDTILETIKIEPLRPEQVRSIEVGYRTIHNKVFYIDLTFYYNWYKDFIGDIRVLQPSSGVDVEEDPEAAQAAVIPYVSGATEGFDLLQIPINSTSTVRTWGFSVGMSYYFGRGITLKGNYTYSDINEEDISDRIIPGFNTPKHKFNIGLEGKRIWKGLGFNTNLKWSDKYLWQAPFGDGVVPSYYVLDAQLNYEFEDFFTTVSVGSSNLLDREYRTAYGSPLVGRMFYASLIFDIDKW